MNILGIHGGVTLNQHDPAAALVCDGRLVASVEEERLVRIKSPRGQLPINAIDRCLREAGLSMADIDLVVHPGETYEDMPARIASYLSHYFGHAPKVRLINHQQAHLASAFFHSGFKDAMCLSYDAYGDRLSGALALGSEGGLKVLETRGDDNSLGLFYATMTSFLGFLPSEDEYKVMGLAAYGGEQYDLSPFARPTNSGYQVDASFVRQDPPPKSIFEPFYSEKLVGLLGEPRRPSEPITDRHRNIAWAAQNALERCAVSLVSYLHSITKSEALCLAGGVALNCSLNLVLRRLLFVKRLFVQPAASDRGLALGCALQAAFDEEGRVEPLGHVYYGPTYTEDDYRSALDLVGADYRELDDGPAEAARRIAQGEIIAWHQGRSEFGPRALGHRSILADARSPRMKDEINARVKFREEFRPFAPAVLAENGAELFEMEGGSPYMTVAFPVREEWRERLPAVSHVNGTARVQTVHAEMAPEFHRLISAFGAETGVPSVLNTSFNVRGEPIVETPLDALSTFARTGIDSLFLGPFMVRKGRAPRA